MARVGKRNGKLKEATHMRARDAELNICNTMLIPGQHVTKSHHMCVGIVVWIFTLKYVLNVMAILTVEVLKTYVLKQAIIL